MVREGDGGGGCSCGSGGVRQQWLLPHCARISIVQSRIDLVPIWGLCLRWERSEPTCGLITSSLWPVRAHVHVAAIWRRSAAPLCGSPLRNFHHVGCNCQAGFGHAPTRPRERCLTSAEEPPVLPYRWWRPLFFCPFSARRGRNYFLLL